MCEGLLRRHVLELVARAAAEGAARRGEDDGVDRLGGAARQALVERGVLAVDGEEEPASLGVRGFGELAGRDEALLVRKGEVDPVLESPKRGGEAGEADDSVQDEVGLGALEELGEVAADLRERREAVDRLRAGRGGDELEARVPLDDLERLAADRARRAQDRDPLHRLSLGRVFVSHVPVAATDQKV